MGAIGALFGAIGGFLSWLASPLSAIVKLRAHQHVVKRGQFEDHCSSYKERIAVREKEFEQAVEGPDKDNKRRRLSELRDEYDQFLEAWQQQQELAKLVPRGAVSVDAPKLPPEQIAQLVELLAGSTRLPAILLTADDYLSRGNAYHEAGDYERALEAYNSALKLAPDNYQGLNNRGNALGRLGRFEEALRDYGRALGLAPTALEGSITLVNRGATLHGMGRPEQALRDYAQALQLSPANPAALFNRGTALMEMNRHEEAIDDYDAVLKIFPDSSKALNNRGNALAMLGRWDEAIRDYHRALDLRPEQPLPRCNRARAFCHIGEFEDALKDLQIATEGDEEFRVMARVDPEFETLRNDPTYGPRFWEIVGREDDSKG